MILSPGLKVEKTYIGYWYWGRPSPEQLWIDLAEVYARIKDDFDPTMPEARARYKEPVSSLA